MKKIVTLRDILVRCNLEKTYKILFEKHAQLSKDIGKSPDRKLEECVSAYSNVVNELLAKPKGKAKMPINVQYRKYPDMDTDLDISFLNLKYEKPPKGSRPWGGKNPPVGCYNCNLNKYNKFFGFGAEDWKQYVNAVVMNKAKFDDETLVAEILWEITFYGFSEKKTKEFFDKLNLRAKKITENPTIIP